MVHAVQKYKTDDWEVGIFDKFLRNDFSLHIFFWFICCRELLIQHKDTNAQAAAMLLAEYSTKQLNSAEPATIPSFISVGNAVIVLRALANKEEFVEGAHASILSTLMFANNGEFEDVHFASDDVELYIYSKFENSIKENEYVTLRANTFCTAMVKR